VREQTKTEEKVEKKQKFKKSKRNDNRPQRALTRREKVNMMCDVVKGDVILAFLH